MEIYYGKLAEYREWQDLVNQFVAKFFEAIPMDMLGDEGTNYENWELSCPEHIKVKCIPAKMSFECTECGEQWQVVQLGSGAAVLDDAACDCGVPAEPLDHDVVADEVFVLEDQRYVGNPLLEPCDVYREDGSVGSAAYYLDESEAKQQAQEISQDYDNESRHNFPWVNNIVYLVSDNYVTPIALLEEAGLSVGTYKGTYLCCGINGGGYSFFEHHWSRLVALVYETREWELPFTINGMEVTVTTDNRTIVERLAELGGEHGKA